MVDYNQVYENYIETLVSLGFDLGRKEHVQFRFEPSTISLSAYQRKHKRHFKKVVIKMLRMKRSRNKIAYKGKCIALYDHPFSKILKLDIDTNILKPETILEEMRKVFDVEPLFLLSGYHSGFHLYYKIEKSLSDSFKKKLVNKINEKITKFKIDKICTTDSALRPLGIKDYTILDSKLNVIELKNVNYHVKMYDFEIENQFLVDMVLNKENKEEEKIKGFIRINNKLSNTSNNEEKTFELRKGNRVKPHFALANYCISKGYDYDKFKELSFQNNVDSKDMSLSPEKTMKAVWDYAYKNHNKNLSYKSIEPNDLISNELLNKDRIKTLVNNIVDTHFKDQYKKNRLRIKEDIRTSLYEILNRYYYEFISPKQITNKLNKEIVDILSKPLLSIPDNVIHFIVDKYKLQTNPKTLKTEILNMLTIEGYINQVMYSKKGWLKFKNGIGFCKQFEITNKFRIEYLKLNNIKIDINIKYENKTYKIKDETLDKLILKDELKNKNDITTNLEIIKQFPKLNFYIIKIDNKLKDELNKLWNLYVINKYQDISLYIRQFIHDILMGNTKDNKNYVINIGFDVGDKSLIDWKKAYGFDTS